MEKLNGLKNKIMKKIIAVLIVIYQLSKSLVLVVLFVLAIKALNISSNTIEEFNRSIKKLEDTPQALVIDSLQLEIMEIGSQLDSMHLKYDE